EINKTEKDTTFDGYYIDSTEDEDDQINGSNSEEDNSSCDDEEITCYLRGETNQRNCPTISNFISEQFGKS
ncbi:unnamed protein product, partial [Rotaria sordida]